MAKKATRKKTKKTAKKAAKSSKKTKRRSTKSTAVWPFIIGIIILVIAIVGIVLLLNGERPQEQETDEEVIVTVNGEEITESQLQMRRSLAPAALQGEVDDQLVEILVAEELLMQEAQRRGVAASEEKVDEAVGLLLQQGGMTAEDLDENLAAYGMSEEEFRAMIRQQLSIIALLNGTLDERVKVTDEEVAAYYEENSEEFFSEGTATVKHVLIAGSEEEQRLLAEDVLAQYEEGRDFCELVEEYTADEGSREDCGQYTFPKGVMVPAFEEAAFAMETGETRIVQTQFGYHVMLKLEETEGRQLSLEETAPAIRQELERQEQLAAYESFIEELRAEADIVYTDEAPTTPEPPRAEQKESDEGFAACIGEEATVYTASWDTASQEQLALFGEDVMELTIVECTANEERCTAEGIEAYPTWVIGEQRHLGKLSLEMLSQMTGCQQ